MNSAVESARSESSTLDEIRALRRTMRDMLALAALPALWVGLSPEAVLRSLAEALHQIVRGEWVFVSMRARAGDFPDEPFSAACCDSGPLDPEVVQRLLGAAIEVDGTHDVTDPREPGTVRAFVARLPVEDVDARLACASRRLDFPREEEALLMSVAVNQGAIALDKARLYEAEQRARAEAEAAVRARDEFLGIASHELRNPLAGLRASLQLLRRWHARDKLDPERLERFLGHLDDSSDRLAALLEDLLDVSRLRTGQLQLRAQPTDLAELVTGIVESHRQQHPDREMSLSIGAGEYGLLLDPDRIEQVVANLLSNALKYSAGSGKAVRVSLAADSEGGVLLQVQDAGIGLPTAAEESIFEPFGRAANAQDQNIPGMGLGLYICRQIAQSHGGRIWAASAGEGRGTTMSLWLPRAERVADG